MPWGIFVFRRFELAVKLKNENFVVWSAYYARVIYIYIYMWPSGLSSRLIDRTPSFCSGITEVFIEHPFILTHHLYGRHTVMINLIASLCLAQYMMEHKNTSDKPFLTYVWSSKVYHTTRNQSKPCWGLWKVRHICPGWYLLKKNSQYRICDLQYVILANANFFERAFHVCANVRSISTWSIGHTDPSQSKCIGRYLEHKIRG